MEEKHFQRVKENFTCKQCKKFVHGGGYTNHCPHCLWSRHVDKEFPGDRASLCGGMMKPVGLSKEGKNYVLSHKCTICGHTKPNKVSEDDNFQMIIHLSQNLAQEVIEND